MAGSQKNRFIELRGNNMSYSIGFYVIEKDTNKYVCVGCSNVNPSYNYSKVLKSAMRWDYKSSEYYRCDDVLKHISLGIEELFDYKYKYIDMLPYRNILDVETALESIRERILELGNVIPITSLYMKWE